MTDGKYTIGLDFGSLSCRGVLVRTADGSVLADAVSVYPHGAMSDALPDGTPLPGNWCVQHPQDFIDALTEVVTALTSSGVVPKEDIAGICCDFTASTVIPLDETLTPLCFQEKYASRPHAWPKMWKHHAAVKQTERLNEVSREQNRPFLKWYGGKINTECLMAKVIQTFDEDREVYDETCVFMEAADFIPTLLTGKPCFSTALAAAKAFWCAEDGYPDGDFFAAIHPELRHLPEEKLMNRLPDRTVGAPGQYVGTVSEEMAEKLGLCPGTAVAASTLDAYTPMLGLGIAEPNVMMFVMGTSTGIMVLSDEEKPVEGVTVSRPALYYPELWGYGSGQASVGDGFQWFCDNCVPERYTQEAKKRGIAVQQYLTELAQPLEPGASGVIALDWINGNKSCLGNAKLSGMFLGLNMNTRAEHIFRAVVEATAFGARMIVEAYKTAGVAVKEIRACGGIAMKNAMLMQIYADVLGVPIRVSACQQGPALGAAIYAAVGAGIYPDNYKAVEAMADTRFTLYTPDPDHQAAYETLYQEYKELHDYFGRGGNRIMERLYDRRMG